MQTKTVTQKPTLSVAKQQELKALKRQINEGHETIEALVKKAKDKANEAITEAVLTGEHLIKAKTLVPYGQFQRWLKENCKAISIKTAQRYMTLATRKSQLLKTDIGLRQAYALVGIIKDDSVDQSEATTTATYNPLVFGVAVESAVTGNVLKGDKPAHRTLAQKSADKARSVKSAIPAISKDDALSRARFLATELINELTSKINNELIDKETARQIVEPLFALTAPSAQ